MKWITVIAVLAMGCVLVSVLAEQGSAASYDTLPIHHIAKAQISPDDEEKNIPKESHSESNTYPDDFFAGISHSLRAECFSPSALYRKCDRHIRLTEENICDIIVLSKK